MESLSDKRRLFEISGVFLTGLGKIVLVDLLKLKLLFIIGACFFWLGYLVISYKQHPEVLTCRGFRRDNFRRSFRRLFPLFIICVILFFTYGLFAGKLILSWHIFPILLLYPLWGVIQQYLIVGLVAGNLQDQKRFGVSRRVIM